MKTQNTKELKHGEAILSKPLKKESTLQTLFNREYKKWYKILGRMTNQTFFFTYKDLTFMCGQDENSTNHWFDCIVYDRNKITIKNNNLIDESIYIPFDLNIKTNFFNWIERNVNEFYSPDKSEITISIPMELFIELGVFTSPFPSILEKDSNYIFTFADKKAAKDFGWELQEHIRFRNLIAITKIYTIINETLESI